MPAPRVTVITPTFNRARHLPETIASVLGQGWPNLEYLVIDDGSTDDTALVVAPFVAAHPGTVVYLHHENRGESATVNRGWALATGDYVTMVNSDDPQGLSWLAACIDFMERHPGIVVGYPDWIMIDEHSRPIRTETVPEYDYALMVSRLVCLPGPGAIIRREAVGAGELRDPGFRYGGDYECWLRLGLKGKFARIPGARAQWRSHGGTTTQTSDKPRAAEYCRIIDHFFRRPDLPPEIRRLESQARASAAFVAAQVVAPSDRMLALRYMASALAYRPLGFPLRTAARTLGLPGVADALDGAARAAKLVLGRSLS